MNKRVRVGGALLLAAAGVLVGGVAARAAVELKQTDVATLGSGSNPGQLSGLTWLGGNQWRIIADKRNELWSMNVGINPVDGKFLPGGTFGPKQVLLGTERDFEGIAYTGPVRNSLLVAEEDTPAVREFDLNTLTEKSGSPFVTPGIFSNRRGNLGFESLTYSQNGKYAYTANEEALNGDGSEANSSAGTPVRLLRYDDVGGTLTPGTQWAYQVDMVHGANLGGSTLDPQSGLSDMLVLPDGRLIVLERSVFYEHTLLFGFFPIDIPHFQNRFYLVDLAGQSVIDSSLGLNSQMFSVVQKTLLLTRNSDDTVDQNSKVNADNIEGIALGRMTDHGWTILGVSDNGDNSNLNSRVFAFELTGVPEPGSAVVVLVLGGVVVMRRRRV